MQQFEKQENLEIEELQMKQTIAIGLVNKLRTDVKNQEIKAFEHTDRNNQEIVDVRKELSKYKDMFLKLSMENEAEIELTKFDRENGFADVEVKVDKEALEKEIQTSHYKEVIVPCDQCDKRYSPKTI